MLYVVETNKETSYLFPKIIKLYDSGVVWDFGLTTRSVSDQSIGLGLKGCGLQCKL